MIKKFCCISLVFLFSLPAWPQAGKYYEEENPYFTEKIEKKSFNESSWRKTIKGLDYNVKEKKTITKKKNGKTPSVKPFDFSKMAWVFRFFILVLVVGILIFLVFALLNRPRNRKIDPQGIAINIEALEDNLEGSELKPLIQNAMNLGDYQLAIRLYFLETLKQLSVRHLIRFKKNKTNREYLFELRKTPQYAAFQELSLIFDRIRYSGQELSAEAFWAVEPKFQSMLQQLSSAGYAPKTTQPA
jgi:hypothetical protein